MRVPSRNEPAQPVTYLWERHKEVARRVLAGQRPIDICKDLGYTAPWMSTLMNSPVFKEYLAKLRERTESSVLDIRERISKGADKSVDILYNILTDDKTGVSPALKVKVAQDFLDRDGHSKITKIQGEITQRFIDDSKIIELKNKRALLLQNIKNSSPTQIEDAS